MFNLNEGKAEMCFTKLHQFCQSFGKVLNILMSCSFTDETAAAQ